MSKGEATGTLTFCAQTVQSLRKLFLKKLNAHDLVVSLLKAYFYTETYT